MRNIQLAGKTEGETRRERKGDEVEERKKEKMWRARTERMGAQTEGMGRKESDIARCGWGYL